MNPSFIIVASVVKALLIHILFCVGLVLSPSLYVDAQVDNIGSGRAIEFDGLDDHIVLGNIYDDLTYPFTISAWINVDPTLTAPGAIFASQDNADLYNGFWFFAGPSNFFLEYGDGEGSNNPVFRRGKSIGGLSLTGEWNHICAVVHGRDDIELFLNGHNVGGSVSGGSSLPMASNYPNDVARIGQDFQNATFHRFKGIIDEVRVFNIALSQQKIREEMCRQLSGNETALIGYWNFNEISGPILYDQSKSLFHGNLIGNPSRVFSGAPIGDESVFLYSTAWGGVSISLDDFTVSDVVGDPYGVHIYKVTSQPSQIGGLTPEISPLYYGIFLASDDNGNTCVSSSSNTNADCQNRREDNSIGFWDPFEQSSIILDRSEIISNTPSADFSLNLGRDTVVCDANELTLVSSKGSDDETIVWSTGEETTSISVYQSGMYWVHRRAGCSFAADTILVLFDSAPPPFDFGDDIKSCPGVEIILRPYNSVAPGWQFLWQDGTHQSELRTQTFGKFWVEVSNACGMTRDTISVEKNVETLFIPNVFTPNDDGKNNAFVIMPTLADVGLDVFNRWGKLVYGSKSYDNKWDGNGLSTGIYFYLFNHPCFGTIKGTVHIIR